MIYRNFVSFTLFHHSHAKKDVVTSSLGVLPKNKHENPYENLFYRALNNYSYFSLVVCPEVYSYEAKYY